MLRTAFKVGSDSGRTELAVGEFVIIFIRRRNFIWTIVERWGSRLSTLSESRARIRYRPRTSTTFS